MNSVTIFLFVSIQVYVRFVSTKGVPPNGYLNKQLHDVFDRGYCNEKCGKCLKIHTQASGVLYGRLGRAQ